MSLRFNKRRSSGSSSRKLIAQITKQLAAVLPGMMSQIQHNLSANNASASSEPKASQCSFKTFTSTKPPEFDGTEGATALLQWYDQMESKFLHIECPDDKRTRFATSVFAKGALTWWVKEKTTRGAEVSMAMPWDELKELMTKKFCPPSELMNLEAEYWNLKQESGEHAAYTSRFNELSVLVPHFVTPTSRAIDKYIKGLPTQIQDSVLSSAPK
ncbi:uncharacterized protein LOC143601262 [Bidens hawaiensis]|uniref:uncharacterized protein LOC143601262 n=1 Tax=Bidens hawaiensis TaxID=980011 RepID=UPI00404ADF4D